MVRLCFRGPLPRPRSPPSGFLCLYLALPVCRVDQNDCLGEGCVRHQDLVQLVIDHLPGDLQRQSAQFRSWADGSSLRSAQGGEWQRLERRPVETVLGGVVRTKSAWG